MEITYEAMAKQLKPYIDSTSFRLARTGLATYMAYDRYDFSADLHQTLLGCVKNWKEDKRKEEKFTSFFITKAKWNIKNSYLKYKKITDEGYEHCSIDWMDTDKVESPDLAMFETETPLVESLLMDVKDNLNHLKKELVESLVEKIRLYAEGHTMEEVAAKFGMKKNSIAKIKNKLNRSKKFKNDILLSINEETKQRQTKRSLWNRVGNLHKED